MGGEVSKERFESDGAAAHEPGVDLENPVKVSVARHCQEQHVEMGNAVSRRSGRGWRVLGRERFTHIQSRFFASNHMISVAVYRRIR